MVACGEVGSSAPWFITSPSNLIENEATSAAWCAQDADTVFTRCSARAARAQRCSKLGNDDTSRVGLSASSGEGTLGTHRSFLNRGPPSPHLLVLVAEVLPDLPPINARLLRTPPTTRARPTTISASLSGPVRDQEPRPLRCRQGCDKLLSRPQPAAAR